ncbi:uracil-DNA glycosylase [Daldinia loculata]|uniref:uracil-DNA glycosylase n=1 Tax=Daldinia loculata TaxID=103429 RepID=UPI0020C34C60|nr:uracil-DNA glycosylase [Daldinia loculata]KAI1642951.1 uracil-DNA glycosylase [Daldinia loculata]KAI2777471.1 uracil-DNA glycosylase [Daldinia loculata]
MSSTKRKSEGLTSGDANKKPKVNASITSFFGAPKSSPTSSPAKFGAGPEPAPLKFDKDKWVAGLTPEQKRHLQLEIQTLDPSWLVHLREEITSPEFIELKKFLESEVKANKKVFPPREDVYSWSRHTPFNTVKCVILGQDPYHNVNQAHGLAFSVRPPTKAPPSLKNMYIALKKDYPDFVPPPNGGGLLTPWAERGVLMINTCLTVRAHEANSHANRGWERFTQKVIDLVAQKRTRGVVFLAWGNPAAKRVTKVDTKRHLVLKSAHPSPLSASRGFYDCGHFKQANEWLANRYGEDGVIDWNLNPSEKKPEEAQQEVSPPVVAVGKANEEKGEEESKILQEEGEEGKEDKDTASDAESK